MDPSTAFDFLEKICETIENVAFALVIAWLGSAFFKMFGTFAIAGSNKRNR